MFCLTPAVRIYAWFSSSPLVYIYELLILSYETESHYALDPENLPMFVFKKL